MTRADITFFDLDHTLINIDCEQAWVNMLVDLGVAPDANRALQAKFTDLHAKSALPAKEYVAFLVQEFIGKSEAEMAAFAMRNFRDNIARKIFPEAIAELRGIQTSGGKPVLLSGSFHPIVLPIAAHLGFEDIVCTELQLGGDRYTGALASEFCVKGGKLKRAWDFCRSYGVTLDDVGFYGDSLSDLPMLESVGRANVVNPGPELLNIAKTSGWRVLNWRCI